LVDLDKIVICLPRESFKTCSFASLLLQIPYVQVALPIQP